MLLTPPPSPLRASRQVNMEHVLLRQLTKRRRMPVLAVLTERVVTSNPCTLSENCSFQGLLGLKADKIPAAVPVSRARAAQLSKKRSRSRFTHLFNLISRKIVI